MGKKRKLHTRNTEINKYIGKKKKSNKYNHENCTYENWVWETKPGQVGSYSRHLQ